MTHKQPTLSRSSTLLNALRLSRIDNLHNTPKQKDLFLNDDQLLYTNHSLPKIANGSNNSSTPISLSHEALQKKHILTSKQEEKILLLKPNATELNCTHTSSILIEKQAVLLHQYRRRQNVQSVVIMSLADNCHTVNMATETHSLLPNVKESTICHCTDTTHEQTFNQNTIRLSQQSNLNLNKETNFSKVVIHYNVSTPSLNGLNKKELTFNVDNVIIQEYVSRDTSQIQMSDAEESITKYIDALATEFLYPGINTAVINISANEKNIAFDTKNKFNSKDITQILSIVLHSIEGRVEPSTQQLRFQNPIAPMTAKDNHKNNISYHVKGETPLRNLLCNCLCISLDDNEPLIFDAFANLTQLNVFQLEDIGSAEIQRATFVTLRNQNDIPYMLRMVQEACNTLLNIKQLVTFFSIFSDTARNPLSDKKSQLCRFSIVDFKMSHDLPELIALPENELFSCQNKSLQVLSKAIKKAESSLYATDSCNRKSDLLLLSLLDDIFGGATQTLMLTTLTPTLNTDFSSLFQLASQASSIINVISPPPVCESGSVAKSLQKYDNEVLQLYHNILSDFINISSKRILRIGKRLTGQDLRLTTLLNRLSHCTTELQAIQIGRTILMDNMNIHSQKDNENISKIEYVSHCEKLVSSANIDSRKNKASQPLEMIYNEQHINPSVNTAALNPIYVNKKTDATALKEIPLMNIIQLNNKLSNTDYINQYESVSSPSTLSSTIILSAEELTPSPILLKKPVCEQKQNNIEDKYSNNEIIQNKLNLSYNSKSNTKTSLQSPDKSVSSITQLRKHCSKQKIQTTTCCLANNLECDQRNELKVHKTSSGSLTSRIDSLLDRIGHRTYDTAFGMSDIKIGSKDYTKPTLKNYSTQIKMKFATHQTENCFNSKLNSVESKIQRTVLTPEKNVVQPNYKELVKLNNAPNDIKSYPQQIIKDENFSKIPCINLNLPSLIQSSTTPNVNVQESLFQHTAIYNTKKTNTGTNVKRRELLPTKEENLAFSCMNPSIECLQSRCLGTQFRIKREAKSTGKYNSQLCIPKMPSLQDPIPLTPLPQTKPNICYTNCIQRIH